MFKKKVVLTKGLFCCVHSFRVLVMIFSILALFVCSTLTVLAADANGNTFVTVDDYGEISFAQDNSIVTYTMNFPSNWIRTGVWGEAWEDFYGFFSGDYFGFYRETYVTSYRMHPFGGIPSLGVDVGDQLENCCFFDITTVPRSTTITFNFTIGVDSGLVDPPGAYRYLFFVDENGKIVRKSQKMVKPSIDTAGSDGNTYTYTYSDTFGLDSFNVPETAVGFYPMFTLRDVECDPGYVYISYEPYTLTFPMTALEYESQQNQKLLNTINEVQNALVEQGEKIDQLPGQIGDEMQNVMDNEREQSKGEGNKFVDQITGAMPDPSKGVIDALGKLTSAVGYTGTEAIIEIPKIVLPGIDGLFDEFVIYEGTNFDLGACISYLPGKLVAVVQSLFTIAIVLYCVYEFKGIISFIFTLRSDNNNG